MPLDIYFAFILASVLLLIIPGPTVLLVIGYGLGHGRRAALHCAAGVVLGDFTAMGLSLLGLSALLAASAVLFTVLKLLGAIYLGFLGVQLWKQSTRPTAEKKTPESSLGAPPEKGSMMRTAWLVTALNPKAITFFVAFLPQFVQHEYPVAPQLLLLGSTFLVLSFFNALSFALAAGSVRQVGLAGGIASRGKILRRGGACACLAAGAWSAWDAFRRM